LCNGIESISLFNEKQLQDAGIDSKLINDSAYVRARGVIEKADQFDARFFGYTPREAELMDPQHRIFLECAWEALENAGYNTDIYHSLIGVYAGMSMNSYFLNNLFLNPNITQGDAGIQILIGNDKDFLATRVSYKLNLQGPSVVIQSACSTSLVAVHLACQGLLSGECDMALAGGVSIKIPHESGYIYQEGGILSPDGHCRAFDAKAQGTVGGNGIGIVVLKRLADAIADKDHIFAVIKGSAINNDGSNKVGYTAPSISGQANVIARSLLMAEVHPETISYIETHGTGTNLGDPIEIAALTECFRASTEKKGFCALGSVKTNIGHLDAAAGVTSLIKTVLALKHKKLPPSLHFENPNPKIDFDNSPFYVNTTLREWKVDGIPRRAGVSSFGIGGTNAHVVLEEAPPQGPSGKSREWQLLMVSAKTVTALENVTTNMAEYLKQCTEQSFTDIAYTLKMGRRAFKHRRILVCRDHNDAVDAFMKMDPKRVFTGYNETSDRPIRFMFPGQGTQYVNMALELYKTESVFHEQVDHCCKLLQPVLGIDLRKLLYPSEQDTESAMQQLKQTIIAQPALFVIEYAMARLWMSWGVKPQAMIGHSIGEYVAACLAGVFCVEDALRLVAERGRMMQQMPAGAMLAVALSKEKIEPFLGEQLSLAAINEPSVCVVSGPTDAIASMEDRFAKERVPCRRLYTSHAFHSRSMDEILEPFSRLVSNINLHPPKLPYISNVTGTWITDAEATDAHYWARHLRKTVLFAPGIEQLLHEPEQILLEVGPGRSLSSLLKRHPDRTNNHVILSSIRHPKDQQSDIAFLLNTLGKLWLSGIEVDWSSFYADEKRHRIPLPTYPFERESYWIAPQKGIRSDMSKSTALGKKSDISEWFYIPSWKRSALTLSDHEGDSFSASNKRMLMFIDSHDFVLKLVKQIQELGYEVITVSPGENFSLSGAHSFTINPCNQEDYDALIRTLEEQDGLPSTIGHLWSITTNKETQADIGYTDRLLDKGIYSLLYLTQALGKRGHTDPLQINVISNNMQEVTGDDLLYPEKATLLGPCKVIPKEYPNITCRSIDILIPQSATRFEERLINQLKEEFSSDNPATAIAYRGNHRLIQTFEPIRLNKPHLKSYRLRQGGVYLITGGLGGIGLVLAEYLAKETQARLILTSRSGFPEASKWQQWLSTHEEDNSISRKIIKLKEIEQLGAEVLIIQADVTNEQKMKGVISQAKIRFGQINGVIHSAGLPDGTIIQRRSRKTTEEVFAPKVKGTLVLDSVLKDNHLDFLILCSSLASILGPMGQVGYCSANAFLDAFAYNKRYRDGTFTIAINWDTWQEVGMALKAVKQLSKTLDLPISQSQTTEVNHPLFDYVTSDDPGKEIYVSHLSVKKHWVLNEHRVKSQAVLPGTAYLEIARAAFEKHVGHKTIEMCDVYFLRPLIVSENEKKEVRTILTKKEYGFEFSIMSCSNPMTNQWVEHVKGAITCIDANFSEKLEIREIEARCNERERIVTEKMYGSQFGLVEFGPRWRNKLRIKSNAHEGLAFVELPEAFVADLDSYKLHPALLDSATAFMFGQFREKAEYLPLLCKKIRVSRDMPGKIFSHVRYTGDSNSNKETLGFDITIMDEQGLPIVEIEDYILRRVNVEHFNKEMSQVQKESLDSLKNYTLEEELLKAGLLPEEGVDVFTRILANNLPQVLVSTQDFMIRVEQSQIGAAQGFNVILDRNSEGRPMHKRPEISSSYTAPRDDFEQKIADVWQELLGIQQIGIHDDFFELGGHSLIAIQIISRLHKKFDVELPIAGLFEAPNVADLAEKVKTIALGKQIQVEAGESLGSDREEIEI
jgi:acyl transferase domain-containing protein/acyl carrier protein